MAGLWRAVTMVPGFHPLTALAAELARHSELDESLLADELVADTAAACRCLRETLGKESGLILFVDQLEELVTLSDEDQSHARQAMPSRPWPPGFRASA